MKFGAVLSQHSPQLLICEEGLAEGGFREALRLAKTIGSEVQVVVCSLLGEMDVPRSDGTGSS
jgi:hypothetical protein